jgi:hypothetical protein
MTKNTFHEASLFLINFLKLIGLILLFCADCAAIGAVFKFFEDPNVVIQGIPIAIYAIVGVVAWVMTLRLCLK